MNAPAAIPHWAALLRRDKAMAYVDLTSAKFEAAMAAGEIPYPIPIVGLSRRISEAAELGVGIDLSHDDLLILQECGAIAIADEALEFLAKPRDFPRFLGRYCPDCDPSVYFIQSGEDGPIKIGVAKDPAGRRTELQTAHPNTLRLLAVTPGGLPAETYFHVFYRREHIRGEWFRASPRLLAFIAELQGNRP